MSGFPGFEPFKDTQLIIVHMDDSASEISFGGDDDDEPGGDATRWEVTRQAVRVHRRGAYTCFPLTTVKSYTLVYPEMYVGSEDETGDEGPGMQMVDRTCPHCGAVSDHTKSVTDKPDGEPVPGDVSQCFYCNGLSIFTLTDGGRLICRKATDSETDDVIAGRAIGRAILTQEAGGARSD